MKKRLFVPIILLMLAVLACSLGSPSPTQPADESGAVEPGAASQADKPTKTPKPAQVEKEPAKPTATVIPSEPVGIRKGFAMLNSYSFTLKTASTGPTEGTSSTYTLTLQHSSEPSATVTIIDTINKTPDETEPTYSRQEIYRFGAEQCSGSLEDGFSYEALDPAQDELQNVMVDMMDFTPTIQNPQFQGTETVNGVQTNHFTFKLEGLGVTSGAEVTTNQGEYWLAVDGNFLVRYILQVETRPNPDETNRLQIEIDMTEMNQPLNLQMPAGCIEAKNNPTPES